ncbi:hypothetical protein GCM10007242_21030 [Pigmentiphaga litoralis]|uniref:DUF2868 domain-containing protein n=1 Tax=Pigmentiphaga litoralis TaxID=516702 RepID=UPI0016769AC6|nr:DUF2868 domain-containing protein [Pigmentiphaga litoralis]GGX14397.1 hypothetical protein GCM10007242_21030 [Pigmentiphaga litoralis]
MDERAARDVLAIRAIETTDTAHAVLDDAAYREASLSARRQLQLGASGDAAAVTPDAFLARRADLLLTDLATHTPGLAAWRQPLRWPTLLVVVLPVIALISGMLTERIANPHRMDLLSLPLLGIVGWNVLVYVGMLVMAVLPSASARLPQWQLPAWLSGATRRLHGRPTPAVAKAIAAFQHDWQVRAAPLTAARWRRALHLAAAALAAGVIASLYLRGLTVEYRVGWESTFMDAPGVHRLLAIVFSPVTALFPALNWLPTDIAALRFSDSGGTANGAPWIHRYALLFLLLIVVPRIVMAAYAHWRAARLQAHFPVPYDEPYFRRLLGALGSQALVLRVIPYSFAVDEHRDAGLKAFARTLLGDTAQMTLRPAAAYGDTPEAALTGTDVTHDTATTTLVLFNLSATPEIDTHGAFVDHLLRALPGKVAVAVDTSAYAQRLGGAGDAAARLSQRRQLWQDFANLHKVHLHVIDLLAGERP